MAKNNANARSIYEIIKDKTPDLAEKTELWDMAEVLEISTGEKKSIDIEILSYFQGEEDVKFLEKNAIERIYSVKYKDDDKDIVINIFKNVIIEKGGLLCSDTPDFMPILISENKNI